MAGSGPAAPGRRCPRSASAAPTPTSSWSRHAPEPDVPGRGRRRRPPRPSLPWLLVGPRRPRRCAPRPTRLRGHADAEPRPVDVGYSLATTRAALGHRAVVRRRRPGRLLARRCGRSPPASAGRRGRAGVAAPARLAFLFTGQGAQRAGMGRGAVRRRSRCSPRRSTRSARSWTRSSTGRCARCCSPSGDAEPPAGPDRATPRRRCSPSRWRCSGCWSRGGSARTWSPATRSVSSPPRTSPGCCPWPTRATLVAARGRLMQALPRGRRDGRRAGDRGRGRGDAGRREAALGIAAVNGPQPVVVSGDEDAVGAIADGWRAAGPPDQAAAGQPRVPLAADGADAGRVPRGSRRR